MEIALTPDRSPPSGRRYLRPHHPFHFQLFHRNHHVRLCWCESRSFYPLLLINFSAQQRPNCLSSTGTRGQLHSVCPLLAGVTTAHVDPHSSVKHSHMRVNECWFFIFFCLLCTVVICSCGIVRQPSMWRVCVCACVRKRPISFIWQGSDLKALLAQAALLGNGHWGVTGTEQRRWPLNP